jgi:excinuclease UvrABC nuclease subunit
MIKNYRGNYQYNKSSIIENASDEIGVYYCGYINSNNKLCPHYIGRAKGDGVSICSRLLDHLREDDWLDVSHFGFNVCTTKQEAENLEMEEIKRCNPKYNIQGKSI